MIARRTAAPVCLIAPPEVKGGVFSKTVILMLHSDEERSLGVVVNRIIKQTVGDVVKGLLRQALGIEVPWDCPVPPETAIGWGGPVDPGSGFIIHPAMDDDGTVKEEGLVTKFTEGMLSLNLDGTVDLNAALLEMIQLLCRPPVPPKFHAAIGCAGWGPGQLQEELDDGRWLVVPAHTELIFDLPLEQRWKAAIKRADREEQRRGQDLFGAFSQNIAGHA